MSFGRQLHLLRTTRGITQRQLADAIQTSDSYVSALETDRKLPSYAITMAIARVVGADSQDLLILVEQTKIAKAVEKEASRRLAFSQSQTGPPNPPPQQFNSLIARLTNDPVFYQAVCHLEQALDSEQRQHVVQYLAALADPGHATS